MMIDSALSVLDNHSLTVILTATPLLCFDVHKSCIIRAVTVFRHKFESWKNYETLVVLLKVGQNRKITSRWSWLLDFSKDTFTRISAPKASSRASSCDGSAMNSSSSLLCISPYSGMVSASLVFRWNSSCGHSLVLFVYKCPSWLSNTLIFIRSSCDGIPSKPRGKSKSIKAYSSLANRNRALRFFK